MIAIDANVLVKLAVTEEYSEIAYDTLFSATESGEPIFAPDIILAEALNTLWVYFAIRKKLDARRFDQAVDIVMMVFGNLKTIPTAKLTDAAMKISKLYRLTFYDALYVATSISNSAPLFTFDKKILESSKELGLKLVWDIKR